MLAIYLTLRLTLTHPIATECARNDYDCITSHNDTVIQMAILSTDRLACARFSTRPQSCLTLYDLTYSLKGTP